MSTQSQAEVLQASLKQHFAYHGDVFVKAHIPVELEGDVTLTPHLLVAIGTQPHERERWKVPEEGTPEVIIVDIAQLADKEHYEGIGVRELFVFDALTGSVRGFWLSPRGLVEAVPEEGKRVSSEELRLELAFTRVEGQPMLRFYQRNGTLLETPEETEEVRRKRISKMIATHTDELEEQIADHEALLKRP